MRRHKFLVLVILAVLPILPGGTPHAALGLPGVKVGKSASKAEKNAEASPSPQATATASKYPDIDAKIKEVQDNLAEAHRLLDGVRSDMTTASLALFGATEDEYEQRAQMARQLVYENERNVEILTRLRKLRDEKLGPNEENEQLAAFLKKVPFTIDQVDDLRGQILDTRHKISSTEQRRALTGTQVEQASQELKDTGVRLRQAQEQLESAKTKAEETRCKWVFEQAQLAERLARTRLRSNEELAGMQDLDLANQRQLLSLQERKLSVAVENAPFTRKELDEKLDKLRDTLRILQKEQDSAGKAREAATRKLDAARAAVNEIRKKLVVVPAPVTLSAKSQLHSSFTADVKPAATPVMTPAPTPAGKDAPPDPNAKVMEQIAKLQVEADLCKEDADTAGAAYTALRVIINLMDDEQNIWQVRFRDRNPNDTDQYNEIQKWLTEGNDKVTQRKLAFQSNSDLTASQLAAQQARLERWKPEDGDVRVPQHILAALQDRADHYRHGMDQIRHHERLLQSWQAETQERMSQITWKERLTDIEHKAADIAGTLWKFELFTVQDTIVAADGKVETKTRSITVGKIIILVLILLLSGWICHRVADLVRRVARVRFRARESHARLLYKTIFFSGLLLVIIVTLTTLKIPLAIFAFLGGALAIGIGFGAQNLINNFISGLILIFERPIKIGDIVEVEGQCGKVLNIGGRCSRIKRFDGIDILIPNSSFLEKNVVNWTLSDLLLRMTITVGVAYGSPARDVSKLIARAVEEHGQILKDPAPVVVLEDFGDNAMHFKVYFWIEQREGIDSRVIGSDVRMRIDKLFREADIIMAYPQRDIHIDALRPIQVSLMGHEERFRTTPPRAEM